MDIVSRLKKRLEGVVAQVVPGDDKTYSTVVNTPPPTQRNSQVSAMPSPRQTPRPPQRNIVSRLYDQVIPFDSGRTFKQATPTKPPRSVGYQATHNAVTNVAGGLVKPVVKFANTVNLGARQAVEGARMATGLLTDNSKAAFEASKRADRNYERFARPNSGLFRQGTFYKNPEEAKRGDISTSVKRIGGGTLETAATVVPVARGATLLKPGTKLVKALPLSAAEGAGYNAAASAGSQIAEEGQIDPRQLAVDTATGAALGPATYVGGKVAGKAVREATQKLRDLPRLERQSAARSAARGKGVQQIPVKRLQNTDITGYGDLDQRRVEQYMTDLKSGKRPSPLLVMRGQDGKLYVEDGKHRLAALKRIGAKQADVQIVTPEDVTRIREGGYVALPGRGDESLDSAAKNNTIPNRGASDQTPEPIANLQNASSPETIPRLPMTNDTDGFLDDLAVALLERLPAGGRPSFRDLRHAVELELQGGGTDLLSQLGEPTHLTRFYNSLILKDASKPELSFAQQNRLPAFAKRKVSPETNTAQPSPNDLEAPAFMRERSTKPQNIDADTEGAPAYIRKKQEAGESTAESFSRDDIQAPAFMRQTETRPSTSSPPDGLDAPAYLRTRSKAADQEISIDDADMPAYIRKSAATQEAAAPTPQKNVVVQRTEDEAANKAAIRSSTLDRLVQDDLGRAGATTNEIVRGHSLRAGIPPEQAAEEVARIARESGYDLRDGFPVKAAQQDRTPLTDLAEGPRTPEENLQRLNEATEQVKAGAAKGLVGTKHAVAIQESPFQRVYLYADKDGSLNTFTSQRRPDGRWEEIVNSHAPIKSIGDGPNVMRLMGDADLQREVARASDDGLTRQYIWTEDANGTSAGLRTQGKKDAVTPRTMTFDPNKHIIEGGFVRSKETGEIVGNYVAVGPNGIELQIGRQYMTLDIDPSKLNDLNAGNNRFNQAERWVDAVTKDPATREKLRNLIIYPTREAEARMKVEANALGEGIKEWRKALVSTVPLTDRKAMLRDAVYVLEPDAAQVRQLGRQGAKQDALEAFTDAHGEEAAKVLTEYSHWLRSAYDNLLERMNAERRQFGMDEIPRREDYLTHIQELEGNVAQVYQAMTEGIFGDVTGLSTRGKLPAQIAGRTENFKPIQKYNPFGAKRSGDAKPLDPFNPLAAYGAVALHNIHLTRPAAMVRSLEVALRAAQDFVDGRPKGLKGPAADRYDALAKRFAGNYSDSIEWLTEHANILSGKSGETNRVWMRSAGGRAALKVMNFLQRQSGRANIIGNASSVLAQSLNFPNTLGTNGVEATARGIARALGSTADNAPWRKSNFLKERYVDGSVLRNKSALEKLLRPFGVPLGVMERAFVHVAWNSSYERALARGLKGDAAIRAADSATSKIVAGRSIGDTAHIYQSTPTNVPLQFTREVTEAWKNFTKDQTPYGKALTLLAAFGMNAAFQGITGRSPLPDPIGATLETIRDAANLTGEEDESVPAKAVRAVQRGAETVVSGVPLASAAANNLLPQDMRRDLFGSDSDLGRYDGSLALFGPAFRLFQAGKDAAAGELESAGQNAVSALPVGGQIRKTWQGLDTVNQGVTDKDGVVTADVTQNPLNYVKAALFGRNALPEVRQSYEAGSGIASTGELGDALRANDKQAKRLQVELKKSLTSEENDLRKLNADERATLIEQGVVTAEQLADVDRKVLAVKRRLGIVPARKMPKLADGISSDVKSFYKDRAYVYDGDYEEWRTLPAEGSAKKILETAAGIRPANAPELPQTNEVAEMYADLVKRRAAEKWGKQKENVEKGKFLVAAYKTGLGAQAREWYGLSDTQIRQAIEGGEIDAAGLNELMGFDDQLRSVGLPGSIGNTLREDYGYRAWKTSGSKSRAKRPSVPSGYFDNASALGQIRKLIASAKL